MPSSRYQSKVFQFIAQRSMKLRDRTLQGVRQLKLAATWGTQIVLYPFYAIFQSARLVGKQLDQTVRQVFPSLTAAINPDQTNAPFHPQQPLLPPKSDRPIQNLLSLLEEVLQRQKAEDRRQKAEHPIQNISYGDATPFWNAKGDTKFKVQNAPAPQLPPTQSKIQHPTSNIQNQTTPQSKIQNPKSKIQNGLVQGLATLLDQKQLVLVDTDNQIHKVLTWEQQAALQQRIVFEVADYWRDRRQFAVLEDPPNSPLGRRFLPLPKERETMLPPVRYLRHFIAWMQTSPVAIATNIFQESALVPTQQSAHADVDSEQRMNRFGLTPTEAFGLLAPAPHRGLMSTAPGVAPNPLSPALPHTADITSVPFSPNALNGKRRSWWHTLLDWIVSPTQSPRQFPTEDNRSIPQQMPPLPSSLLPNRHHPTGVVPHAPRATQGLNNGFNRLPVELTRNLYLWFDPDYQGSEQGWFNANQINQVRRQREFPPIVPSLPARVSLNAQSSSLNASYASIEADLTEMTEAGLMTTPVSNTLNEADFYPSNPFPESAAAILNTPGSTPDPVALETYLAHHGAAYDFRHTEDPAVDRNVLYRVSAEAETSVQGESGVFALDLTGQPSPSMTNTWLDTTVEVVGYDKHPLERFLGWVDLGMAWIERRIASVWYWMRDRL